MNITFLTRISTRKFKTRDSTNHAHLGSKSPINSDNYAGRKYQYFSILNCYLGKRYDITVNRPEFTSVSSAIKVCSSELYEFDSRHLIILFAVKLMDVYSRGDFEATLVFPLIIMMCPYYVPVA